MVLAATTGSRLFPLTPPSLPKHLLPLCGVPIVLRLLTTLATSGFTKCILAIGNGDETTVDILQNTGGIESKNPVSYVVGKGLWTTVCKLSAECIGSLEALRELKRMGFIPAQNELIVVPGDLVVFSPDVMSKLTHSHRYGDSMDENVAATIALTNVGDEDEFGVPLKESAKVKFLERMSTRYGPLIRKTLCC